MVFGLPSCALVLDCLGTSMLGRPPCPSLLDDVYLSSWDSKRRRDCGDLFPLLVVPQEVRLIRVGHRIAHLVN